MLPNVLMIDPAPLNWKGSYANQFNFLTRADVEVSPSFMAEIDAVVTSGAAGLSREQIEQMSRLKVVAVNGVGLDRLDLVACAQRGIAVASAQDTLTTDVADLAMGLMLDVMRKISVADQCVRTGMWREGAALLGASLTKKRIGIFGLGAIGRAIAQRASAFDMQVAYASSREDTALKYAFFPSLLSLAEWADVLILSVPGGAKTVKAVDRKVLDALGRNGYLINIARGSVVDEDALVYALHEGRIAGAGLDVFADEPNVPHALLECEKVVLQPHRASSTVETRAAMAANVFANLSLFFREGRLVTSV